MRYFTLKFSDKTSLMSWCLLHKNSKPQVPHCRQCAGVRSDMRGVKYTFVSTLW